MGESMVDELKDKAMIFSKLGKVAEHEALEKQRQAEVMAEVCRGLHDMCLLLSLYIEEKQRSR